MLHFRPLRHIFDHSQLIMSAVGDVIREEKDVKATWANVRRGGEETEMKPSPFAVSTFCPLCTALNWKYEVVENVPQWWKM